jgi:hypothetical protein
VLYTDFPEGGKVATPTAEFLARAAVASVAKAQVGKDGISYLLQLIASGIQTPLTADYQAAILRLTGAGTLQQALGWLQGSRVKEDLKRKLWERAGEGYDADGYFPRVEDNLLPGVELRQFEVDMREGAGHELRKKLRAIHSSSALVVNTFAPFRDRLGDLAILGQSGYRELCFEKPLPTGLPGTPPHVDVWLRRERGVVAVESKLLEYFQPREAKYKESYTRTALPWAEDCWRGVLEESKASGKHHLDVAQLVKHYLGLSRCKREEGLSFVTLLYLFWEPSGAPEIAVCRQHRVEVEELAKRVAGSAISFKWMSYPQLWADWQEIPSMAKHVVNLKARYGVECR